MSSILFIFLALFSKTVVLKLEHASPGEPVKTWIAESHPQSFWFNREVGPKKLCKKLCFFSFSRDTDGAHLKPILWEPLLRGKKKNQNSFTQTSRIQLMAYLFTVSFSHPKWHSSTSKFWTIRTLDLMVNAASLTHQPWVELPVIKHLSQSLRSGKFSSSANFLVSPFPTTVETCFLLWELRHYSSRPFMAKIKLLSADQSWVLPTMYNAKQSAASVLLPAFSTPSWALLISSLGWRHGEPSACRLQTAPRESPATSCSWCPASACCTASTWPGPPAQHYFYLSLTGSLDYSL